MVHVHRTDNRARIEVGKTKLIPRGRPGAWWLAVVRALFLYLFVAWLVVRYASDQSSGMGSGGLVYVAILAGFPVAATLAAWLSHRRLTGEAGVWGTAAIAVLAAAALPLACMQMSREGPSVPEIVLTPAAAGAAVLTGTPLPSPDDGLRLRIRGLSVVDGKATAGSRADRAAEILLMTSVDHGDVGDELVVLVRLVAEDDGDEIWRAEYRGDPSDLVSVRRLLIRALTEAMSLTNEGLSGGQTV